MDMEQERKDFEDWMSDGGLSKRAVERNSNGDYILMQAAHAWEVWQAASKNRTKPAAPVVWPEPDVMQYESTNGEWKGFMDARHQASTIESGEWNTRNLYTEQTVLSILNGKVGQLLDSDAA